MTLFEFFVLGGPLMYVLGVLSVAVVAIAAAKSYQFYKSGLYRGVTWDGLETELAGLDERQAGKLINAIAETSPIERVMKVAMKCFAHPNFSFEIARAEVSRVASAEIQNLESAFKILSSIAYLSPLIGLLGTVQGMIKAFANIESAGKAVSPALLAGGIWEALLTTAFGLGIAIVALMFQYYFESVIDQLRLRIAGDVTRIQTVLAKSGWSLAQQEFGYLESKERAVSRG